MSCHVDGYTAVAMHTHVIGEKPVTGRLADIIGPTKKVADIITKIVNPGIKVSFYGIQDIMDHEVYKSFYIMIYYIFYDKKQKS